jgi:sirohydrochlorin ferrochelatase
MVPYFLSAGVHLRRDLVAARDELGARHPGVEFLLGPALGPHPMLDALVEARIHETSERVSEPHVTDNPNDHPVLNAVDTESANH